MTAHRDPQWGIKSMPPAERQLAAAAAQRQDRSQGEWLAEAIRTQLMLEAGKLAPPAAETRSGCTGYTAAGYTARSGRGWARVCSVIADAAGKPMPRCLTWFLWQRVAEWLGVETPPCAGAGGSSTLRLELREGGVDGDKTVNDGLISVYSRQRMTPGAVCLR